MFRRKRAAEPPVPASARWRQLYEAGGELVLYAFSQAERDAVVLDPAGLQDPGGGNYLQPLSPLLARAQDVGNGADWQREISGELATAAAGLEELGFMRSGPPAPPVGTMPVEWAGLAATGSGQLRKVALAGDLGLVARMRDQPMFIGEAYAAADPAGPDPAPEAWQLVARVYVPYQFPCTLVERPAGPGGLPPHVLADEPHMALAVMGWLGADVAEFKRDWEARKAARDAAAERGGEAESAAGQSPVESDPQPAVQTADLAARFARVAQLRIMQPDGENVRVRFLMVASGPDGLHLLDGSALERATPVTVVELGQRVDTMLTSASAAGQPGDTRQSGGTGQPDGTMGGR